MTVVNAQQEDYAQLNNSSAHRDCTQSGSISGQVETFSPRAQCHYVDCSVMNGALLEFENGDREL